MQDYDATNGYKTNAAEATSLLNDVPVVINQHKHVPIKLDFLDAASAVSQIRLLEESTMNCGYVLAKSMADYCLGLASSTNFSQAATFSAANSDLDMLISVREAMNTLGTNPSGRFGIVGSPIMEHPYHRQSHCKW